MYIRLVKRPTPIVVSRYGSDPDPAGPADVFEKAELPARGEHSRDLVQRRFGVRDRTERRHHGVEGVVVVGKRLRPGVDDVSR
jgi:hypothetical protein